MQLDVALPATTLQTIPFPVVISCPIKPPPELAVLGRVNVKFWDAQFPMAVMVKSTCAFVVLPLIKALEEVFVIVAVPQVGVAVKASQGLQLVTVIQF